MLFNIYPTSAYLDLFITHIYERQQYLSRMQYIFEIATEYKLLHILSAFLFSIRLFQLVYDCHG
jgi:hypothetical protein